MRSRGSISKQAKKLARRLPVKLTVETDGVMDCWTFDLDRLSLALFILAVWALVHQWRLGPPKG